MLVMIFLIASYLHTDIVNSYAIIVSSETVSKQVKTKTTKTKEQVMQNVVPDSKLYQMHKIGLGGGLAWSFQLKD